MKNLILAAAAIASVAGAASASGQTSSNQLSKVDIAELRLLVPNADLDNLTPAQLVSVQAALHGSDEGKVAALHTALLR